MTAQICVQISVVSGAVPPFNLPKVGGGGEGKSSPSPPLKCSHGMPCAAIQSLQSNSLSLRLLIIRPMHAP